MKRLNRAEQIFEEFKLYFPSFAKNTIEYYQDGPNTIVVKLKDGFVLWYDDDNHSVAKLPESSHGLDRGEFMFQFKRRLTKLLDDRFLTQKDLAEMIGMKEQQLSRYLTGKTMPSFFIVDCIAKALNCSTDELRYHD